MITYKSRTGQHVIAAVEFFSERDEALMLADAADELARRELRDAFRRMREREARWNQLVTPELEAITYGGHWSAIVRLPVGPELTVWGRVLPLDEVERSEREHGATAAEIAALLAHLRDGYARGWRFSRCYSVREPDGEDGAWHIAKLAPATPSEFARARAKKWRT